MSKSPTRDGITSLFRQFAGKESNLVIPRPYIDFCGGDHLAALLLSQILYWSDRTDNKDGWFAKSYQEWHDELGLTEYQIKRAIKGDKRSKKQSFGLASIGVEAKLKPSKFHEGAPTLHYRIDNEKLQTAVHNYVQNAVLDNVQNGSQTMFRTDTEQRSELYTETIVEITSETKEIDAPKPKRQRSSKVIALNTPSKEIADTPPNEQIPAATNLESPPNSAPPPQDDENKAIAAIIGAWLDCQDAVKPDAYGRKNYRTLALAMHKKGITPDDVRGYIKTKRLDPFWNRFIKLEMVAEEVGGWKAQQRPVDPAYVVVNTPPPPANPEYAAFVAASKKMLEETGAFERATYDDQAS